MALGTRRLLALGAAVVVLGVGGVVAYVATRESDPAPKPVPTWAGPPLGTTRGSATEIEILPPTVEPLRGAAQALGVPEGSFAETGSNDGGKVYAYQGVTVRIREDKTRRVTGERPPVEGDLPGEDAAIETAETVLAAFGLEPERWTPTARSNFGLMSVQFKPKADLPVFAKGGVIDPFVSVGVDSAGVRSFLVTLTRLRPRSVEIRSQQEAWGAVAREGTFDKVRLVLVDSGLGVLQPHWEFTSTDGKHYPVLAVLTP